MFRQYNNNNSNNNSENRNNTDSQQGSGCNNGDGNIVQVCHGQRQQKLVIVECDHDNNLQKFSQSVNQEAPNQGANGSRKVNSSYKNYMHYDYRRNHNDFHHSRSSNGYYKPGRVTDAAPHENPNKIYIGSLSENATSEQVNNLFAEFGEMKEAVAVEAQDQSFGNNGRRLCRGFGFVTMYDPENINKILVKNEEQGFFLQEKRLSIRRAKLRPKFSSYNNYQNNSSNRRNYNNNNYNRNNNNHYNNHNNNNNYNNHNNQNHQNQNSYYNYNGSDINNHSRSNSPAYSSMQNPNQNSLMNSPNQNSLMNSPNQNVQMNSPIQNSQMNSSGQHMQKQVHQNFFNATNESWNNSNDNNNIPDSEILDKFLLKAKSTPTSPSKININAPKLESRCSSMDGNSPSLQVINNLSLENTSIAQNISSSTSFTNNSTSFNNKLDNNNNNNNSNCDFMSSIINSLSNVLKESKDTIDNFDNFVDESMSPQEYKQYMKKCDGLYRALEPIKLQDIDYQKELVRFKSNFTYSPHNYQIQQFKF